MSENRSRYKLIKWKLDLKQLIKWRCLDETFPRERAADCAINSLRFFNLLDRETAEKIAKQKNLRRVGTDRDEIMSLFLDIASPKIKNNSVKESTYDINDRTMKKLTEELSPNFATIIAVYQLTNEGKWVNGHSLIAAVHDSNLVFIDPQQMIAYLTTESVANMIKKYTHFSVYFELSKKAHKKPSSSSSEKQTKQTKKQRKSSKKSSTRRSRKSSSKETYHLSVLPNCNWRERLEKWKIYGKGGLKDLKTNKVNISVGCGINTLVFLDIISREYGEKIVDYIATYKKSGTSFREMMSYVFEKSKTVQHLRNFEIDTLEKTKHFIKYLMDHLCDNCCTIAKLARYPDENYKDSETRCHGNYVTPGHSIIFSKEGDKLFTIDPQQSKSFLTMDNTYSSLEKDARAEKIFNLWNRQQCYKNVLLMYHRGEKTMKPNSERQIDQNIRKKDSAEKEKRHSSVMDVVDVEEEKRSSVMDVDS